MNCSNIGWNYERRGYVIFRWNPQNLPRIVDTFAPKLPRLSLQDSCIYSGPWDQRFTSKGNFWLFCSDISRMLAMLERRALNNAPWRNVVTSLWRLHIKAPFKSVDPSLLVLLCEELGLISGSLVKLGLELSLGLVSNAVDKNLKLLSILNKTSLLLSSVSCSAGFNGSRVGGKAIECLLRWSTGVPLGSMNGTLFLLELNLACPSSPTLAGIGILGFCAFKEWTVFTIFLSCSRCSQLSSRWSWSSFCCSKLSSFLFRAITSLKCFSLDRFEAFRSREEEFMLVKQQLKKNKFRLKIPADKT